VRAPLVHPFDLLAVDQQSMHDVKRLVLTQGMGKGLINQMSIIRVDGGKKILVRIRG
jgi:hypothetical protein